MNTGQIIKSKLTEKFTVIPNEILKDKKLSFRAKGLICFLLSLSSDFVINKTALYKFSTEGRDAVVKAFEELVKAGYILQVEIRNGKGHFKGYNYIVYNVPTEKGINNPITENPITENPISENPISENPLLLKKQDTKEPINKRNNISDTCLNFAQFWDAYNKKVGNKSKIEIKFNKLSEEKRILIKQHLKLYVKNTPDKRFRKNPETYLNNESWNDEIISTSSNRSNNSAAAVLNMPINYNKLKTAQ